jgi:hypothetical protein
MRKATERTIYEVLLSSMSLQHHILAECLAMVRYAFSSGRKVPGWLVERLETIATQALSEEPKPSMMADLLSAEDEGGPQAHPAQANHTNDIRELAAIHGRLSDIIVPASPRTILLLASEATRGGFWSFLGPVRLVRGMVIVALSCLVTFIALSLSPEVSIESISKNVFESDGFPLLLNLLFLLTAAGLGACFAALFLVNHYIAEGTFDPKYESSYWIRFILGLMAGLILSQMVPLTNVDHDLMILTKPTLAMLGGFSAAVVYRIIHRLIEAVESLVKGENRDITAIQEQALQAHLAAQSTQTRMQLVASLTKLHQQLAANVSPEALHQELDRIMGNLVPPDEERVR